MAKKINEADKIISELNIKQKSAGSDFYAQIIGADLYASDDVNIYKIDPLYLKKKN